MLDPADCFALGTTPMRLDMPTLYASLAACCLVLSLVWAMASRSFPALVAARFWSAGTFAVSIGAVLSIFRGQIHPLISIIPTNALLLLGAGLIWAGMRRYRGRPAPWLALAAVVGTAVALLGLFAIWTDSFPMRVLIYSATQSIFAASMIAELLSDPTDRRTPGVIMATSACSAMVALNILRVVLALSAIGGEFSFTTFNPVQSVILFLLAASGVLVCQFGCLLMAMDRARKEMAALAVTDELTGIANRRHFFEWAEQESARSGRTGRPFSLMLIDIDRFKWINDNYGHGAGDEFLRHVTRLISANLRTQDLFARLGGDEFCVLMPETSVEQAGATGERLADLLRGKAISHQGSTIASTISVGVVQWTPAMGAEVPTLMAAADRALYQSKADGRDSVTVVAAPAKVPRDVASPASSRHMAA